MQAEAIFFWIFSVVLVAAALGVIVAKNPVHSVLFLILAFVNASGLFLLMGAEFLGMILIVVYVGAVAVLFLFVIMLLDVDFTQFRQGFVHYFLIGIAMAFSVGAELWYAIAQWDKSPASSVAATPVGTISNTAALGRVLYTHYFFFFQAAGMILLTAMIGAIVLTLRHKEGVKRQNIAAQVARTPATAIELRKVASRAGV
jgi:NADH-quinone oxidoreductase subunit J